jgi:hypothetical protein
MSTKAELMEAHKAMVALMDAKFGNSPEWKAFRAIDRALLGYEENRPEMANPANARFHARRKPNAVPSYTELADRAIQETGVKPIATGPLIEFIGRHRELGDNVKRATISITSTLSKSDRFISVPWEGGRAWWYAGQPVPKRETAGS